MHTWLTDLSRLSLSTEYRSIKDNPATLFYEPCLVNSSVYKRAVGYFRSSVYLVVGESTLNFARRGGRVMVLCSPELSQEDVDGIAAGYGYRSGIIGDRLVEEIDRMLTTPGMEYPVRVLATLIAAGALDIRIALRRDQKGIYHEKLGIFVDGQGNRVSFKGSANETWSAWDPNGNFESIEVFCSWRGGLEAERVRLHEEHFDSLWKGNDPHIEVFDFPFVASQHLQKLSVNNLDELEFEPTQPRSSRTALPHQLAALTGWLANDRRGIFKHATGSGKTFTALLAIRDHIALGNPALIVIPSRLLLDQWAVEIRREFPGAALLVAGGGHNNWRRSGRLRAMTIPDPALGSRIVLATMQTAATDAFRKAVVAGSQLLLVADEVHQIGSPLNSRLLHIDAGSRLGLSATPERFGDPEGTNRILDYFSGIIPPEFSLSDAIAAGRLVQYEYFPHIVRLNDQENQEWREITSRIIAEIARQPMGEDATKALSERAKLLLIERSRIAKKAENKIALARQVIEERFQEGQHWLVYCEDLAQLRAVMSVLRETGVRPIEYHSSMNIDSYTTLEWFKTYGGVLVSIRCLDEGVDIPAISDALVLASSQNPRQFIQRRGRVLRASPGKHLARIHDALVLPTSVDEEPTQTSLVKAEMARAMEFADHAINRSASAALRAVAIELGLNPGSMCGVGIEDDQEDDQNG